MAEQNPYDGNGRMKYEAARQLILAGESVSVPGRGIVDRIDQLPPPEDFARGNQRAIEAAYEANERELEERLSRRARLQRMAAQDADHLEGDDPNAHVRNPTMGAAGSTLPGMKIDEPLGRGHVAAPAEPRNVVAQTQPPLGNPQRGDQPAAPQTQAGVTTTARTGAVGFGGGNPLEGGGTGQRTRAVPLAGSTAAEQGDLTAGAAGSTGGGERARDLREGDGSGGGTRITPESELPDDFPAKHILAENEVSTIGQVQSLTYEQLDAMDGIAEGRIRQIDEYLTGIGLPRHETQQR